MSLSASVKLPEKPIDLNVKQYFYIIQRTWYYVVPNNLYLEQCAFANQQGLLQLAINASCIHCRVIQSFNFE